MAAYLPGCLAAYLPICLSAYLLICLAGKLPSWQAAKLPSCQAAKLPSCQAAKLPSCQATAKLASCQITKLSTPGVHVSVPSTRSSFDNSRAPGMAPPITRVAMDLPVELDLILPQKCPLRPVLRAGPSYQPHLVMSR
jgi:hypothetical protein